MPINVEVPRGSIAHDRPEKLDCEVHDKDSQKDLEKKVPKELKYFGERGGAGRRMHGTQHRLLQKERLKIAKDKPAAYEDAATPTSKGKGKGKGKGKVVTDRRPGGRRWAASDEEDTPAAQKSEDDPVVAFDADAVNVRALLHDEDLVAQVEEEMAREQLEEGHLDEEQLAKYEEAVAQGLKDNSRRDYEDVVAGDSFADDMREIDLTLTEELIADDNTSNKLLGNLPRVQVRKYNAFIAERPYTWGVKVCDESHVLRDPKCGTSRAVMLAKAQSTMLITATLTLNRIEDIFGTALQVWHGAGFFDFSLPPDATWEYMATKFEFSHIDLGDVPVGSISENVAWHHGTDPRQLADNNDVATRAILCYPEGHGPDRESLVEWSLNNPQVKWWLLHPSCVRHIKGVHGGDDSLSTILYRELQSMLIVKTSLSKPVSLPDGKTTSPRSEMPACDVKYVQCKYPKKDAAKVAALTTSFLSMFPTAGDVDEGDGLAIAAPVGPEDRRAKVDKEEAKKQRLLYLSMHRILWFLAIDRRVFETMVNGEYRTSLVRGLKEHGEIRAKLMAADGDGLRSDTKLLQTFMKSIDDERNHTSSGPVLGAGHSEQVSNHHPAGGLHWWYTISQEVPGTIAPSGRFELVFWALGKSPIFLEVFDLVMRHRRAEERVLVVVNNPWMQQ